MCIAVTMPRKQYDILLKGKKSSKNDNLSTFSGCKTKDGVINYINEECGLLGEVVDIKIED